ncbi:hypothetical protein DICPUDRAFT_89356 [Dictyostelium purpureum]|uniref:Late endosomal/lysosomal adaptor and MAPK and MTOR activator 5 n=1 Tax=Dictyostelium purpureum TaxID=5786 RepID=F0ZVD4_DICPU|nr:uncharacterized protein DICPUDRAFT_89356 [Dictyostelium purpureum]EGC32095.1 hypothetical protein DICPUDRAFT_89356 [Dictyostelium purpureum]|eukprot:XP_003291384.1 hypothetical protein DICPUDRAFT_89356 [Dictyostelium purpureum]
MLRSKILPQVLNQAVSNSDTKGVLLMKDDGSLIACSEESPSSHNISKIVAAITANIWTAYNRNSDLQYQLIDCETQKLREYLEEPLNSVEQI